LVLISILIGKVVDNFPNGTRLIDTRTFRVSNKALTEMLVFYCKKRKWRWLYI